MSLTMFCAARPIAIPATPAEARSGARLKPNRVKGLQHGNEADDGQPCGANDSGHCPDLGSAAGSGSTLLGDADHAGGGETQQAAENKGDDRNDNQARQLGVDELLAVVDPLVEDPAQEPAFAGTSPSAR
jgi:hypothetical protein